MTLRVARAGRAALLACVVSACDGSAEPTAKPDEVDASGAAGAWLRDVTSPAGLDFVHVTGAERRWWFPEIMGSGLGLADVDGDGANGMTLRKMSINITSPPTP
jgi:hypothetical protein